MPDVSTTAPRKSHSSPHSRASSRASRARVSQGKRVEAAGTLSFIFLPKFDAA